MRGLLEQTAEQAITYLEGLGARGVAPTEDAVARLDAFDQPLPEEPADPKTVLRLLDEIGSPATMGRSISTGYVRLRPGGWQWQPVRTALDI